MSTQQLQDQLNTLQSEVDGLKRISDLPNRVTANGTEKIAVDVLGTEYKMDASVFFGDGGKTVDGDYTLQEKDRGLNIYITGAARTLTIPASLGWARTNDCKVMFEQAGFTINDAAVTANYPQTVQDVAKSIFRIFKTGTDEFNVTQEGAASGGSGVSDHGALTGLADDDHPHYLTEARHDAITGNPHGVTATDVGLGNVDNTSDLDKPISTATQTALDGKQNTITNSDDITEGATNLFMTGAERSKLSGIEPGATADQTGAEIVSAIDTELGSSDWQGGEPATVARTGSTILFDAPAMYNEASPITGDITLDATGQVSGIRQYVFHEDSTAPAINHPGAGNVYYNTADYNTTSGKINVLAITATPSGDYFVYIHSYDGITPFDPTVFADDDLVGGFVSGFQADYAYQKPTDKNVFSGSTALVADGGTGHTRGTSGNLRGHYINGDGNRSYVVSSAPEWDFGANINDPWTIVQFFKFSGTETIRITLLTGELSTNRGIQFNTNATDFNFWISSGGGLPTDALLHAVPIADVNDGAWHSVVLTGFGTDEANYRAWFDKTLIDGTTYGTRTINGTFTGPIALTTQSIYIGGSDVTPGTDHGPHAFIDEVLLYKRLANQTFVNNLIDKIESAPVVAGLGRSNNGVNPVQGFYKIDTVSKEVFVADNYDVGGRNIRNSPMVYCSGDIVIYAGMLEENSYHRMYVWYQKGSGDPKISIPFDVPANDDDFTEQADPLYHPLPAVIIDPNDNKIIAIQSAKHNTRCRVAKSQATISQIANYSSEQFRRMTWDRLPDIEVVLTTGEGYAYPNARFRPDGKLEIEFRTTALAVSNDFSLTRIVSDNSTIGASTVWSEKRFVLSNHGSNNLRLYPGHCWNFGTCTGFISQVKIREESLTNYRAIGAIRRPFSDYNSHQNIAGTFTKNVTNTGSDNSSALTYAELTANCLITGDDTTAATTTPGEMIQYNDVVYCLARDHDNDLDNIILFRQAVGSGTITSVALPANQDGNQPSAWDTAAFIWVDEVNDKIIVRSRNTVSGLVEYLSINPDLTGGWTVLETDDTNIPFLPINYQDLNAPFSGPTTNRDTETVDYATRATLIV